MVPPMQPVKPRGALAERVRSLRWALGLTQKKLALGGGLAPDEIARIETGRNKAKSGRIRQALARGFGLTLEDAFALIEGRLSVDMAAKRAKPPQPKAAAGKRAKLSAA